MLDKENQPYFYEFLVIEESGHSLFSYGHLARLQTLGPEGTVIIQEKGGVLEETEESGAPTLEEEKEKEKEETIEKKPEEKTEGEVEKEEEEKKMEEKGEEGGK